MKKKHRSNCITCKGRGRVTDPIDSYWSVKCPTCKGTGIGGEKK